MRYSTNLILTEEQMAAYLDGRLSPEEAMQVEQIIATDTGLQDIQATIDDIDNTLITDNYDVEIPAELYSDTFTLPDIDGDSAFTDENELNLFEDTSDDLSSQNHHADFADDGADAADGYNVNTEDSTSAICYNDMAEDDTFAFDDNTAFDAF